MKTSTLFMSAVVGLLAIGANTTARADYKSTVLADNPSAYWRLGEATGTTAIDIVGGTNGTYSGAFTLGSAGLVSGTDTAVTFGGGTATVPYSSTINPTNFTIGFWAQPANQSGEYVVALQDRTTSSRIGYAFEHNNFTAQWDFTFGVTPSSYNNISGTTPVAAGTVYYVVGTYDGTTARLYVNGVLENSTATTYAPANPGAVNLTFGSRNGNSAYNGELDEVVIYDHALPGAKIMTQYLTGMNDLNPPIFNVTTPVASPNPAYIGYPFSISCDVSGNGLTYQWRKGGINIAGATNFTYSVPSAVSTNAGNYDLVVTDANSLSATSSELALTVLAPQPPTVSVSPTSRVVLGTNGWVTFTATASILPPFTYQWQHASTNLPGATGASLTLSSGIQAGTYTVLVTNVAGLGNSASATLTITPPAAGTYAATVVADAPLAYWKLNETQGPTITDSVGTHDGTCYAAGVLDNGSSFGMGQPGPLFGDPSTAIQFNAANRTKIDVPYDLALDQTNFTVEFWCNAASIPQSPVAPVMFRYNSNPYQGWGIYAYPPPAPAPATDPYSLGGPFVGVGSGGWVGTTPATNLTLTTWYHVAFSYDGKTLLYYIDGQLMSSAANSTYPLHNAALPLRIGAGATEDANNGNYWWDGLIDQVALYPKALPASHILQHYSVGKNGTNSMPEIVQQPISATNYATYPKVLEVGVLGTPAPTYQWTKNGTIIPGATLSTLSFPSLKVSDTGNYAVTASNRVGSVTSSNAFLNVVALPTTPYAAIVLGDHPVVYYHLDETNNGVDTVAADAVNFGLYDGSYTNNPNLSGSFPLLGDPGATPKTGTSVNFDGSSTYVDLATLDWLQILGPITLEAWVKPGDSYPTSQAHIVGRGPGAYAGTPREVSLRIVNGSYEIRRWQANVGEVGAYFTMPPEDVGNWVYLVGTFDGADWNLYRNGVKVASTNDTTGSINADGGWAIAAREPTVYDQADSYFLGNVDEVAIYNHALTPAQVKTHYTGIAPPTLTITPPVDGKVVLAWSGLLLQATNITGPWTTNTTAVSPWTNTPSGAREFYRSLVP